MREADLERLLHEGRPYSRTTAFFLEGSLFFYFFSAACFTKDGPTVGPPPFFGKGLYFFIFFSRTLNGGGRNYCTLNGRGHNSAGHYMPADEILILISCWTLWTHG